MSDDDGVGGSGGCCSRRSPASPLQAGSSHARRPRTRLPAAVHARREGRLGCRSGRSSSRTRPRTSSSPMSTNPIDLAPIPGFSGTPINLLVALDAGLATFLDVKVRASYHEPVFVDGLGPAPLFEFVKQYQGKSLKQTIKVGPPAGGLASDGAVAVVDGVAKATASGAHPQRDAARLGPARWRAKSSASSKRPRSRAGGAGQPRLCSRRATGRPSSRGGYIRRYRVSNSKSEAAFKADRRRRARRRRRRPSASELHRPLCRRSSTRRCSGATSSLRARQVDFGARRRHLGRSSRGRVGGGGRPSPNPPP